MKTLTLFCCGLLLAAMAQGQIIHVPADYPTIQLGINAATPGDTVLVDPGTYVENINYNGKNIAVASLFLITQDTTYISQTIIDGNQAGSVVILEGDFDTTALLCGFTITNGDSINGGGVKIKAPDSGNGGFGSPSLRNLIISYNSAQYGGGICCIPSGGGGIWFGSNKVYLSNIKIINNNADFGGGIYFLSTYHKPKYIISSSADFQNVTVFGNYASQAGGGIFSGQESNSSFKSVTIKNNIALQQGGGICFLGGYSDHPTFDSIERCNIYQNAAFEGNDLFSADLWGTPYNVILDTFSVLYPTEYFAKPLTDFTFDILHGKLAQDTDLYVSPLGDNNNSGLTPDEPLKTIHFAISVILADSLNPHTIHLLQGTYSPSGTGEFFPLTNIPDYINISGISEAEVILDAEYTGEVIRIENNIFNKISGMTIINGAGRGVNCINSNPIMENLTISNNIGGGISCTYSNPILRNITITGNIAGQGGGIFCSYDSSPVFDSINRCNIYLNNATTGDDLYSDSFIEVIVDTFTVLYPRSFQSYPLTNFSFDILHGLIPQTNINLYASPDGDNTNSGLTSDDPLKTINHAMSLIAQDSINLYSIQLLNGIYSPSTNEEIFPVSPTDYVSLIGESQSGVILNAEGQSGVIEISGQYVVLSNLTITGGLASYNGGGINCSGYNPTIQNVTITGNNAGSGGGIYCDNNSSPFLENVTITDNTSELGGGIYFTGNTSVIFDPINRCNIFFNNAFEGNDMYSESFLEVIVDTFTVMAPTEFHAAPIANFSFDILHGMHEQANADLYVSPEGDNANSGLTAEEPLKNIYSAFSFIVADSVDKNTIHLLEGTYSPSSNGELFPVQIYDFINLSGTSETEVILDANHTTEVIMIKTNTFSYLSDMTIANGEGGGINCINSNLTLENLVISNNNGCGVTCTYSSSTMQNLVISNNNGSGINCYNSNTTLKNGIISGNSTAQGGGIYSYYSNIVLQNVILTENSANDKGGGIYQFHDSLSLHNVTMSSNSAQYGSGLYCRYLSNTSLINTIMWNDMTEEINLAGVGTSVTIERSDIDGGQEEIVSVNGSIVYWLEGNIDEDPLFVGSGEHPYALSDGSTCIDTGTPDTTGLNLPYGDIIGNKRIWDGDMNGTAIVDMGAYEFGSIPVGVENPLVSSQQSAVNSYPNPFNNSTTFEYELEENASVTLILFDHLGQEVAVLANEQQSNGTHKLQWNAEGLTAGVYYCQLKTGSQVMAKKIIKMK